MQWFDIARRQHGVIARPQLEAIGFTRHQIAKLLEEGHLRRDRVPGVYRSAATPSTQWSESWSAVLAARAVLSYQSAANLWDFPVAGDGQLHVIPTHRRRTRMPPGVRVHRVAITDADVTERFGLPITGRTRTALDCCGILPIAAARTLFDRALQQNWISLGDCLRRLKDESGRHGNVQLRRLFDEASLGDSVAERLLHQLLWEAGIVDWQASYPIAGYVADVAFPASRLVVEVDGWAHHSGVERFQTDRTKQNALLAAGWSVLRYTWADLVERPGQVVREIGAHLERLDG
ncbi:MAG: hypothetical protein JWN61_2523 [Pseudonocardiales bacterium]|nr:hypothetical protein [Pseudonocardiales bacterium]